MAGLGGDAARYPRRSAGMTEWRRGTAEVAARPSGRAGGYARPITSDTEVVPEPPMFSVATRFASGTW